MKLCAACKNRRPQLQASVSVSRLIRIILRLITSYYPSRVFEMENARFDIFAIIMLQDYR
jgi:hypothetical protein